MFDISLYSKRNRPVFILLLMGILLFFTACGEIPRPYMNHSREAKLANQLIIPKDAYGIELIYDEEELSGESLAFYDLLQAEIEAYNMPVSQRLTPGNGFQLQGIYQQKNRIISYDWKLMDPFKAPLEAVENHVYLAHEGPTDDQLQADQTLLAQLVARQIVAKIKPEVFEALEKQLDLNAVSVKIAQIEGAPGDGNTALKRNMISILKKARIRIVEVGQADLTIKGAVQLRPAEEGYEQVRLEWRFEDSKSQELRTIRQQNIVPEGSLNQRWGDTAYLIAVGVVQEAARSLDQLLMQAGVPTSVPDHDSPATKANLEN